MAAPKPPTVLRGVVDDQAFAGLLTDALEHVPDMTWPLSVPVFAQMRRDPQLAAVLKAYALLVLRARWQVDGTGCRVEATQMVADDLGLPVAGVDRPGAARTKGVSWREHLRTALLSLTYGHMGFAMQADVTGAGARLRVLAERMPHTIAEIHADPRTGEFRGVSQALTPETMRGTPEIRADQMVWYCHEREGTGWYGTSLLRPAYGPWLIKREMQRVLATSNRRFGMGVPTIEWAAGVLPTPEQHQAALNAASAARVGDQSGLVLPPGARLVLTGVTGSAPDTIGFIRWLDQQMSGMALARFMDLGESTNGSRALGEAFIDFFMLAVQTVADDIAETATRQIAGRIVAWNWGVDEPVPQIAVADVGASENLTAEAMKSLVDGGLLTVDPGLESWVRRRFRLPDQDSSASASRPAPATGRNTTSGGEPDRVSAAGPQVDPVDYGTVATEHTRTVDELTQAWEEQSTPLVDALAAAVAAEVAAGMLAGVGSLVVPGAAVAAVTATVAAGLLALAGQGARGAARESGIPAPEVSVNTRRRVEQFADGAVGLIVAGYTSAAARLALTLTGSTADPDQVRATVTEHLRDLSAAKDTGLVAGNLSAAATSAQAAGREQVLRELPDGTRFAASERLDRTTCGPCRAADGREYNSLDAALADYPTGRYRSCEGMTRCRGLIYAIVPE